MNDQNTVTALHADADLTLQLRSLLDMCLSCGCLMSTSPEGPCDEVTRWDAPLRQLHCNASDLLH